jgi:hypothetical protein
MRAQNRRIACGRRLRPFDLQVRLAAQPFERQSDALRPFRMAGLAILQASFVCDDFHLMITSLILTFRISQFNLLRLPVFDFVVRPWRGRDEY